MLLDVQLDWLFRCCTRDAQDLRGNNEIQVLSSDPNVGPQAPIMHRQALLKADSFDITFTPRRHHMEASEINPPFVPATPRQRYLQDQLELPVLHKYPVPPGTAPEEPHSVQQDRLFKMYQEFVLELHTGTHLTQLTSSRDYSSIHCQLMEDLETLKLDQCNGRIIEFPLTSVSKVYRIVKSEDNLYSSSDGQFAGGESVEHIVVVEFMRRKLAFVFTDLPGSQRFLMCMELLIRRAQQAKRGKRPMEGVLDMPRSPAVTSIVDSCGAGNSIECQSSSQTTDIPLREAPMKDSAATATPARMQATQAMAPASGTKPGRLSPSMSKPPRSAPGDGHVE